jgi:hypothetical protein
VIALVRKQLNEYNKNQPNGNKFNRKLKANIKYGKFLNLYRGINRPDKTMVKSSRMYWKSFTSTSLETKVAANFGKYTYVITLDTENPHEYIIVPENMTKFKEEEVILFPYFHFECTAFENFTSGARYECMQIAPLDDS